MIASNLGRVMATVHNSETFTDICLMGGALCRESDIKSASDVPRDSQDPTRRYLPEVEWDQQQRKWALEAIKQNIHLLPKMEIYKVRDCEWA
jgi:hypothetical protein